MLFEDLFPSRFFKADDVTTPKVMVIQSVTQEEVGQEKEVKPILRFAGENRGLVLNRVNGSMLQALYGNDVNAWLSKPIELYRDLVQFGGKTVPAVRLRQPQSVAQPLQATVATPVMEGQTPLAVTAAEPNDDITF